MEKERPSSEFALVAQVYRGVEPEKTGVVERVDSNALSEERDKVVKTAIAIHHRKGTEPTEMVPLPIEEIPIERAEQDF